MSAPRSCKDGTHRPSAVRTLHPDLVELLLGFNLGVEVGQVTVVMGALLVAYLSPERLKRQAGEIGRNAATLVELILVEKTHPEQGFRACVGILRLAKSYGAERLEAACARALEIGTGCRS